MQKKAIKALKNRVEKQTKELEAKTRWIEDLNTSLNVILQKRELDKKESEEKMVYNINELIQPSLEQLKKTNLTPRQKTHISIIESTINSIASPFIRSLSKKYLNLTPMEIQVAELIRQGNNTKEIAAHLTLSDQTVETYRKNIRKKVGITHKKIHLRTYLLSII